MKKLNTTILEKVNQIEKNLQSLKLEYLLSLSEKQRKKIRIYRDKDIIDELRRTRKILWNEKYSKVA